MNELITVKRYADQLLSQNPTLIFMVLVNEDLNQVSYEQRALASDPINEETQRVPYVPAAEFARLFGFEGIKVTDPAQVGDAWDRALRASGPVLLEFVTDSSVPPLPPHVMVDQLKKTAKSVLKGDPEAVDIAKHGVKGKLAEVKEHVPGLRSDD
jgi:pyruvate dehydrogenase (quinone)